VKERFLSYIHRKRGPGKAVTEPSGQEVLHHRDRKKSQGTLPYYLARGD